jgi:hypothetical protein
LFATLAVAAGLKGFRRKSPGVCGVRALQVALLLAAIGLFSAEEVVLIGVIYSSVAAVLVGVPLVSKKKINRGVDLGLFL